MTVEPKEDLLDFAKRQKTSYEYADLVRAKEMAAIDERERLRKMVLRYLLTPEKGSPAPRINSTLDRAMSRLFGPNWRDIE